MAKNLNNRKVLRFRTYVDPCIPPKPRNAFSKVDPKDGMGEWEFELMPAGVYVKCPVKGSDNKVAWQEHIVPYANVQSIFLAPEEHDDPKAIEKPKA